VRHKQAGALPRQGLPTNYSSAKFCGIECRDANWNETAIQRRREAKGLMAERREEAAMRVSWSTVEALFGDAFAGIERAA
jgi:hypothetical protein